MSAKLEQLLGYLDRKEVTEIIVGVGRPITLKMNGGYTPLTSLPVSQGQLDTLFGGTALEPLARGKASEPLDCEVGRRRVHVELIRRGDEVALRIQTGAAAQPVEAQTQPVAVTAHASDMRPRRPTAPPDVNPRDMRPRTPSTPPAIADVTPTSMPSISIDLGDEPKPVAPSTTKFATPLAMPKVAAPTADSAAPLPAVSRDQSDRIEVAPLTAAPSANAAVRAATTAAIATSAPAPSVATTAAIATSAPAPSVAASAASAASASEDGLLDERIDVSAIAKLVRAARQAGASDLHIAAGRPVQIRVLGELRPLEGASEPLPADIVDRVLLPLLGPHRRVQLATAGYVDLAFDVQNAGRLRGNVSRQQTGLRGAFRLARVTPPTLEELGLPRELAKVVAHHQGLVVIAGPNGQGKTTTMAALVDLINATKPYHIITIEDPVELEHPRKQAVISQREVGRHTRSFAAALKASLREDPDVIVIGELRDRETVEIALTAAETGHLVLATMSTPSAAKTIDRLIDMFPPADQAQARASIAGALRAIVAQRLLPAAGGHSVVPAVELVTGVLPLAVLIRDDKLYQLPNLMQRGRAFGMIRFEESLLDLLRAGRISEATFHSYNPAAAAQAKAAQQQQVTPAMGRAGRRES